MDQTPKSPSNSNEADPGVAGEVMPAEPSLQTADAPEPSVGRDPFFDDEFSREGASEADLVEEAARRIDAIFQRGDNNKIAEANAVCQVLLDLNGGSSAVCESQAPNKRISLRKVEAHRLLNGKKSKLSLCFRAGMWDRALADHLSVHERGQFDVRERAKMYSALKHDPDLMVKIVKEISELNLHGDDLAKQLEKHQKPKARRAPNRGALTVKRKQLRATCDALDKLAASHETTDPFSWAEPELAEVEHDLLRLHAHITKVQEEVKTIWRAKRDSVLSNHGIDPDEVMRLLAEPAPPEAVECVSTRETVTDRKLVPVDPESKSPTAIAPYMVAVYLPLIFCQVGCYMAGVCYALRISIVNSITKRASELSDLTNLDFVRAAIQELRRKMKNGVLCGGGRNGDAPRDVRINNSGDALTPMEAALWSSFANWFHALRGGAVWGFTRFWRVIPRAVWGRVQIMASAPQHDVEAALAAGYAVATVVDKFADRVADEPVFHLDGQPVPSIRCPYQMAKHLGRKPVPCVKCRLCIDQKPNNGRFVVLFEGETQERVNGKFCPTVVSADRLRRRASHVDGTPEQRRAAAKLAG